LSALKFPDLSAVFAKASLEWRLTDQDAFGLTTASPLQRAVCRIADGRPLGELATEPAVRSALKCEPDPHAMARPRELAILSGIRVGKSLLAAAGAVHMAQNCNVDHLGPGEIPRVPIQIKVVAGSRAGASLVARWSAGCIFDEFPRMVGGSDGVVNWDDSRDAVLLRLLRGCQLWHIGSPWAPYGPAYELVQEYWGKPDANMVVIKAPAWDMNPHYWTPEEVAKARGGNDSTLKKVVRSFVTDVEANFSAPEESLYTSELLDRAMRPSCEPEPGHTYAAAMDPATRGNSWTFGIFTRTESRKRMVRALQCTGSRDEPLSPRQVFKETIAPECKRYGVSSIETDQYYVDALQDIAREFGLTLVQTPLTDRDKTERFLAIRTKMEEGEVELPQEVREDMQRVRRRVTQNGVQIVLPQTSDGRHCDYAPTVMLGIGRYLRDVAPPKKAEPLEVVRMRAEALKRFGRNREND
jgi:hypothetical protein